MPFSAEHFIATAVKELGYQEEQDLVKAAADPIGMGWDNVQKYSRDLGTFADMWKPTQGFAYCHTGVVWTAWAAGDISAVPQTAYCPTGIKTYKSWERWSYYPAVGAQAYFGPEGSKHTAIVIAYNDTMIVTVDFNSNPQNYPPVDYASGVFLRVRERQDEYVYGYGYPKFDHPIKSASPVWQERAAKKEV